MAHPVLYSFVRCPYAMRARMAIAKAGVTCEMREVDLKDKPQALLDISPKATVPVVLLPDGRVLEQSLDIMRWALAQNDPEGWLKHPEAEMNRLIEICDGDFVNALKEYKYADPQQEGVAEKARDNGLEFLKNLEMRIAAKGFVVGHTASLADIAIFPLVRQFALVDWMWFEDAHLLRLKIWLNYFTDSQLFEVTMEKYSPWQPGDPVDVFPIFNSRTVANLRA